jgi:hypothetical protein
MKLLAKLAHTFAAVMKKPCYVSNFHCGKEQIAPTIHSLFSNTISLLNYQISLVLGVEHAQQAVASLNHPIYFFFTV